MVMSVEDKSVEDESFCVQQKILYHILSFLRKQGVHNVQEISARHRQQFWVVFKVAWAVQEISFDVYPLRREYSTLFWISLGSSLLHFKLFLIISWSGHFLNCSSCRSAGGAFFGYEVQTLLILFIDLPNILIGNYLVTLLSDGGGYSDKRKQNVHQAKLVILYYLIFFFLFTGFGLIWCFVGNMDFYKRSSVPLFIVKVVFLLLVSIWKDIVQQFVQYVCRIVLKLGIFNFSLICVSFEIIILSILILLNLSFGIPIQFHI